MGDRRQERLAAAIAADDRCIEAHARAWVQRERSERVLMPWERALYLVDLRGEAFARAAARANAKGVDAEMKHRIAFESAASREEEARVARLISNQERDKR